MNVDPGRPARIARVNFGLSGRGADMRREIKACNEFPSRATRRNTGLASWRERCEMCSPCGMKVAVMDALDEGGRGPELAALTARHNTAAEWDFGLYLGIVFGANLRESFLDLFPMVES